MTLSGSNRYCFAQDMLGVGGSGDVFGKEGGVRIYCGERSKCTSVLVDLCVHAYEYAKRISTLQYMLIRSHVGVVHAFSPSLHHP